MLGALLSVAIVWALTAVLLWEAVPRFVELLCAIFGRITLNNSVIRWGVSVLHIIDISSCLIYNM